MQVQIKTSHTNIPNRKSKYQSNTGQQQDNLLDQSLNLIQTLFNMRFIQKICRPIDKRVKQEYVEKFAGRMQLLHHKLMKIQKQASDLLKSEQENKDKENKYGIPKTKQSIQGSGTLKVPDWRKSIRAIQTRYIQVFEQGSFKFYKKVLFYNNFPFQLNVINIREWATSCINQAEVKKRSWCCC